MFYPSIFKYFLDLGSVDIINRNVISFIKIEVKNESLSFFFFELKKFDRNFI